MSMTIRCMASAAVSLVSVWSWTCCSSRPDTLRVLARAARPTRAIPLEMLISTSVWPRRPGLLVRDDRLDFMGAPLAAGRLLPVDVDGHPHAVRAGGVERDGADRAPQLGADAVHRLEV